VYLLSFGVSKPLNRTVTTVTLSRFDVQNKSKCLNCKDLRYFRYRQLCDFQASEKHKTHHQTAILVFYRHKSFNFSHEYRHSWYTSSICILTNQLLKDSWFLKSYSESLFCGKQEKNLQPLGVTKFSLKGNLES